MRCSGSIILEKNFVPGSDQFIFTIDRLRWLNFGLEVIGSDTDIVDRNLEIPITNLLISKDSYNLVLVIYQVAFTRSDGKKDSRNGHVYVDKRVRNENGVIYWVLLDDEQVEVIREREFENRLLEKGGDVYALVYKREIGHWSGSDEESSSDYH